MIKFVENNRKHAILFLLIVLFSILIYEFLEFRTFAGKNASNSDINDDIVLIQNIVDEDNESDVVFNIHLKKVCDYTKLPLRSIQIASWNEYPAIDKSTKVITLNNAEGLSDKGVVSLLEFVSNGGTLILPKIYTDTRFKYFYGLKKAAEMSIDSSAIGYLFTTNLLPNSRGLKYDETTRHLGFKANQFDESIRMLATAINNQKYPVLLENRIGRGKVITFNTTDPIEKKDRGVLFSSLLLGLEGIPYPIANVSTIFLDDFPSPYSDEKVEIIDNKEYSQLDFVHGVWWPDMKKLADSLQIQYTASVTFDDRQITTPPYLFEQWDRYKINKNTESESVLDWLSHDISSEGHELGFKGYNHVPLQLKNWKHEEYMSRALKTAKRKWNKDTLGIKPVTYIPPSGKVSQVGFQQVVMNLDSIKYFSSYYLGDRENGSYREFDTEPWDKTIFDFPKITNGFLLNDNEQVMHQSLYLYTGIWTHSVNASVFYMDSLQTGTKNWKTKKEDGDGLFTTFSAYLAKNKSTYPLSKFYAVKKAAPITQEWRESIYEHKADSYNYTVQQADFNENDKGEFYWFVYASNEKFLKVENQFKVSGLEFSKTPFLRGFLYNVKTNLPKLLINSDINTSDTKFLTDIVLQNTLKEFEEYKAYDIAFNEKVEPKEEQKDSIERPVIVRKHTRHIIHQQKKQTESFDKLAMLNEKEIDTSAWVQYFDRMIVDEKPEEAWQAFKEYVAKNPSKDNVLFSKNLSKKYGYANNEEKNEWLAKQYLASDSLPILKDYYKAFNTEENASEIAKVLKKIDQKEPNYINHQNYVKHLLVYDSEKAESELDNLIADETSSLWDIADKISHYYAEKEAYRKAYDWSKYSQKVPFTQKMDWLTKLNDYETIEKEYTNYITLHQEDDAAKAAMSKLLLQRNNINESWETASTINNQVVKDSVKELLNAKVIDAERVTQKELLEKYNDLFKEDIQQQIVTDIRVEENNFAEVEAAIFGDEKRLTSFSKSATYNSRANESIHSITASHTDFYKIDDVIGDEDNINKKVYGVSYAYKKLPKDSNKKYVISGGVEVDENQQLYGNGKAAFLVTKEKSLSSAEVSIEPAQTNAAYEKKIYRTQLVVSQTNKLTNWLQSSVNVKGKYYSDENYEGFAIARLHLESSANKLFKIIPFAESSFSKSNVDGVSDYPYYILDKRFNIGGGAVMKLGNKVNKFNISAEASTFLDNDLGNFNKFKANATYKIGNFSSIKISSEFSTQPGAYSNFLLIGLSHIF
ncbi:MAG: DUF2194 domain-containing protein [Flavobacteriaceae bacterium]|nr:DUF2194 domain-containing protein [Flavobacteriaceae bacterium]